uniref:F-box domain-containing protein n=1 Tax=Mycena chlorophos TaxID=658473 RepID=A0ABQ0KUE1_MYCCL|nr:predicted protein [Mycena chlorophos]
MPRRRSCITLPRTVWRQILSQTPWNDFVAASHVSLVPRGVAQKVMAQRIQRFISAILLSPPFSTVNAAEATARFLAMLNETGGVVTGSLPLALLTLCADEDENMRLDNLNVIVPIECIQPWYRYLLEEAGFNWYFSWFLDSNTAHKSPRSPPPRLRPEYRDHVRSFACMHRRDKTITLSGTTSRGVFGALLAGRNTSAMNFLTKDVVYSCYPKLTIDKTALAGWAHFWNALTISNGGITGSTLFWLTQPNPAWYPNDINVVVGAGGTQPLEKLFRSLGWVAEIVPSRLPRVIPYPTVLTMLPYPEHSPWASQTTYFTSSTGDIFTVTETVETFPIRLLLESEHTLQAGILSPAMLILLYPRHIIQGRAIVRGGGVHRRSALDRRLDLGQMRARDITAHSTFYATYSGRCRRNACPGCVRRLRGGRGILFFPWCPARERRDNLAHHASTNFEDGRLALVWSWGVCENYLCPYFRQPRDLFVKETLQWDESETMKSPKLRSIFLKIEAIHRHLPTFPRVFHGYLFPTSCHKPLLVPVPLDLHASDYKTIDDLRIHTWIVTRSQATPRIPIFMPPTVAGGSVAYVNTTARRVHLDGNRSIVVFLQSTTDAQRRNLLLFPITNTAQRAIHGDVLVVCFEGDAIVAPSRFSLDECRTSIQRYAMIIGHTRLTQIRWFTTQPRISQARAVPSARTAL